MALERAWQTMWKSTTNLNGAITLTRIVPQSGLQAFSNAPHTRSAPQSGSKGSGGVSSYLRLPAQSGFSSATVHPSQLRMPSRSGSHSIAVGVSPVRHLAALPLMVHQNVWRHSRARKQLLIGLSVAPISDSSMRENRGTEKMRAKSRSVTWTPWSPALEPDFSLGKRGSALAKLWPRSMQYLNIRLRPFEAFCVNTKRSDVPLVIQSQKWRAIPHVWGSLFCKKTIHQLGTVFRGWCVKNQLE